MTTREERLANIKGSTIAIFAWWCFSVCCSAIITKFVCKLVRKTYAGSDDILPVIATVSGILLHKTSC